MHLFSYFYWLAFILLNVANKITDGHLLKAKLGIFIEERCFLLKKRVETFSLFFSALLVTS